MKLALIPPIDLLEYTDETWCQLMLPHLLEDGRYRYTYQRHCKDPDQYVIMDNGVAEGEQIPFEGILFQAHDMGADEIVLPDVLFDLDATVAAANEAQKLQKPFKINYMFVCQGSNYEEFRLAAQWAKDKSWINTIGIPRHMIETCDNFNARADLAHWLYYNSDKPVHLLGGSHLHPTELRDQSFTNNVRSTDTSSPFNYAFESKNLRQGNHVKRPMGYFERPAWDFEVDHVRYNVEKLMKWTGNER